MTAHVPADTFALQDMPLAASRRQDGWSAANQRRFLEAIAEGCGVETAARHVGLSPASAYAFRRTAKGAAFALGWRAATLVARDAVAETLMVRAIDGQVDTYTRADGTTVTRHRHDNRLAMSLLARLDRQVESAPDVDVKAARLVAQEFDAFLDLVDRDEGPARAGLFLARRCGGLTDGSGADPAADQRDLAPIYALAAADRLVRTGVATAEEVDVADLDPANRAGWSAEQWQRAEAAGLVALAAAAGGDAPASQHPQHSPAGADADSPVWWNEQFSEWRTYFPPPAGFRGDEEGFPHQIEYERTLTPEEEALMGCNPEHYTEAELHALVEERIAFFAALAPSPSPESVERAPAPADAAEQPIGRDGDPAPVAGELQENEQGDGAAGSVPTWPGQHHPAPLTPEGETAERILYAAAGSDRRVRPSIW